MSTSRGPRAPRVLALVIALCLAVLGGLLVVPSASAAGLPTRATWLRATGTAMNGSLRSLAERVDQRQAGERLAVVMDIDNTSLQSHYAYPQAVPTVLRYAQYAHSRGVEVFFATGRAPSQMGNVATALQRAGYDYTAICHRNAGETLVQGKVRCRSSIRDEGYSVIAMVGNRATDFTGGGWERAWRLPNYGNRLG